MNALLVLENVGVRLPNRLLFEGVNWTLYDGMRVALAGRNGSGKSTLLRIMAHQTEPTYGQCTYVGGRKPRIGFLDQGLLENAAAEAQHLKDKTMTPVGLIKHKFLPPNDEVSEEEQEWEIRKILSGLGFSKEWMDAPFSRLSGGWLLRIFIAGALLQKPEILLLDEPTNHLDLSSIQWLEEFLEKEYEGALILVTHDVELQKRVTNSLAIVHGSRFYFHTHQSDYITFQESLVEEKRLLAKNIEAIQKRIDENMEFVYKFRAKAQTAARAQSKLKAAEDMTAEMNELKDRLARVEGNAYKMSFNFRSAGTGSKFPLSTKNLSFQYSENSPPILKDVTFDIKRGQRIAIIGDNGAGKTTLLNVLAERLKPTSGELLKGHAVEMGYFGQHQLEELALDQSVIDNLRHTAHGVSFEELRGWLGAFGFSTNEEIEKKAKVLSGGEKARLALLRILVTRINVCLLDEPTNHLDVETKALLKNAIKNFDGTTIIVSHDREFIGDVAERILYLSNDHKLTDHFGNLQTFFEKYPQLVRHLEGKAKPSQAPTTQAAPKPTLTLSYEERKKIRNLIKSLEKKISAVMEEIDKLGHHKENLPADAYQQISETESALAVKMSEWEKMGTELEILKKKFNS